MVLHKTGTLGLSGRPGSIPGVGVFRNRTVRLEEMLFVSLFDFNLKQIALTI